MEAELLLRAGAKAPRPHGAESGRENSFFLERKCMNGTNAKKHPQMQSSTLRKGAPRCRSFPLRAGASPPLQGCPRCPLCSRLFKPLQPFSTRAKKPLCWVLTSPFPLSAPTWHISEVAAEPSAAFVIDQPGETQSPFSSEVLNALVAFIPLL